MRYTGSRLMGFLFSLSLPATSDANTDDVIEYQWDETTAIDMPDDLEIAQFDFLRKPNTVDDKQVFVTGECVCVGWGAL